MHLSRLIMILLTFASTSSAIAQEPGGAGAGHQGPTKDVTYHVIWLIESDDVHRVAYSGPARDGLTAAGFGRLVPAGTATAAMTIGQGSTVSGGSRYGQMLLSASILNTTEKDEVQVTIDLQTKNLSPISINSAARVPLGRWFLLGAAESRVGLPKHADDGKRSVAIMKIDDGVMLLD